MRVHLQYEEGWRLSPVRLARLLCDIEGVVFAGVALYDAAYKRSPIINALNELDYSHLINVDRDFRRYKIPFASHYDLEIDHLSYNSPPKIEISVRASLNVQKCLEVIFQFIEHLIHHREHGQILAATAETERQQAMSATIKNAKAMADLLDRIRDPDLRAHAERGLIARIVPLFDESGDYAPLKAIEIKGPKRK